ncbi:MocR-like pyridoxine biosynthesis transcription factor PdxR [Halalkalibacter alkalisediminis]|uniref:PLP-dependent aminotransferase family protein n=1 Tax=Halalkalibacter alkalisediminis TaxID=935616 RepID=A0ABV6NHQ0_9BACI|nr:PLP-dependent aminotransferase family protein [Halalkalibacter alkalisediminis]
MRKTKYNQIIKYITEKITRGEWSIGTKIPSQRELANLFKVNRSTVVTALEELIADGLLETKIGKGTLIANNTWTLMSVTKPINWAENVTLGLHKASMKMVKDINEAEAKKHYIQLGKSELSPELFPLKDMKRIMGKVTDQISSLSYEEPKGSIELRKAICSYLEKKGIYTSPSSVLVVSGALQALQLISIGLLRKGSTIFLEKPSYLYSLSVFQSAEMKFQGLSIDQEGLIPKEITELKTIKESAVLYTIPTFHNPTGILMSEQRRQELMKICEKEQIPIIEDDVYGDLWMDTPPPAPLKKSDKYGNVLYLGSLSKTLSPGLRIGWMVGPESVIERLADLKMQTDYGSSSLSQKVALEWLASGLYEQHLILVREQLKIRREVALKALTKNLTGLATWDVPMGGFFIWVKIYPPLKNKHLFEKALSEGILINPGNIYAQSSNQYIRLSYAFATIEDIQEGIKRLGKIIKTLV